jgi:hypothetical protein
MKIIEIYIGLLLLLFCYGCTPTKKQSSEASVIKIAEMTPADIAISKFTTGMDVVKLETSDSCLLGNLSHIRITDEHLYIKGVFFNGIYEFDRQGRFIKRLHKAGQGPGEYIELTDFIIDEQENTLEIWDAQTKKLLIYNLSDFAYNPRRRLVIAF